jgi:hypothetical protein
MKNTFFLLLLLFSFSGIDAQIFQRKTVPFQKFGNELKYALTGGLNAPQFSAVDLNNDGVKDLFIFDRAGNVILTFINNGTANTPDYVYAPQYQRDFPELKYWVMLRDYNGDGIEDIFAYSDVQGVDGIIVYTGSYSDDNRLVFDRFNFVKPNFPFNVIPYKTGSGFTNLYVTFIDYPSVDDIDGDGDLDIVTFAVGGGHVHYYQNRSVEMGYGLDSLVFFLEDNCWGRFYESGISEIIDLSPATDSCVYGFTGGAAEVRHAGSTVLTLDVNNDGAKEVILGDLSFANLNLLHNGGDSDFAFMVDQDTFFPKNTLAADIPIFPASFYLDVDNDGKKDLLASPNSSQTGEDYNAVWWYKNTGSDNAPVFQFMKKNFLVEHMIDMGTDAHPVFVDYNADGLLDLVVGNSSFFMPFGEKAPRIYLFENIGTPTSPLFDLVDDDYLNFSQIAGPNNFAPAPAFGDLDNDGDLDLLIGEKSGAFFYAENTAGPGNPFVFGNLQFGYMGLDVGQNSVPQIVDLDRDGKPDIIAGERRGLVSYFRNEGTTNEPHFIPNIDSQTPAGDNIIVLGGIDTRYNNFYGNATPVILDFDGEYRIFAGSQVGYLMHYSNIDGNIDGEFTLETDHFGGLREGFNTHPAIADIDNDGILEMIVGNERGGLSLFKTNINTDGTSFSTHYVYNKPEVKLFPNPTTNIFNIEIVGGTNGRVNFSVLNMVGQEMRSGTFTGNAHRVDCQGLSSGIYFVRLDIGGEVVVEKIVIGN